MAQPIAPEIWNRAVAENDPKLLPNKHTRELFKGNGGIKINPDGGICHLWDFEISDHINTYDDRRINGLSGKNTEGRDGWGASAYGPFQTVMFSSTAFAMSRHRSLAYRIFEEYQYKGNIGEFGDAYNSNYEFGGQKFLAVAQQIKEVQTRVQEEVIGPDMDAYNMFAAVHGKINGRLVAKPGYDDNVFDGDPDHYDWVAEPGPYSGVVLRPKFAPIQCMELEFRNIFPMLENLRNAWAAVRIPYDKCIIAMDPNHRLKLTQVLTGNGLPILESTKTMMENGTGDSFKLNGFTFDFQVAPEYFPYVYVDQNLNVVHSSDGRAAYDKYINSITPEKGDPNPFRTRLIASYRMGVKNYLRTVWNPETFKFERRITNYPLGEIKSADYYGDAEEVPFANLNHAYYYPYDQPGAGVGLPAADEVPEGWTGKTATGPVGEIVKRKVVGLALYPQAVALSNEFSEIRTEDGGTRGKFTEMVMDIKYDCWVLPQYSLGVVPILDIDDDYEFAIPVSVVSSADSVSNLKEIE